MGIAVNMGLSPEITAGAVISGAYFGDKSSPLSDSANLAAAAAGVDLYQHVRETFLTSLATLPLALALFWYLGEPGDFDTSEKINAINAINAFFPISLVLFLPLVIVVILAVMKLPPFAAIFIGALAGAVLAVFIAPERVIAFAGGDGLPRPVALLKGVWLARASGYKSSLYGSDARRRDRQLRALRRLLLVEPAGHHRLLLRRRRMLPLEKSPEPPVAP